MILLHILIASFIVGALAVVLLYAYLGVVSPLIGLHGGNLSQNVKAIIREIAPLLSLLGLILGIHHGVNRVYQTIHVGEQDLSKVPWIVGIPYLLLWMWGLPKDSLISALLSSVSIIVSIAATRYFLQRRSLNQRA